jgi:hypothetical protein
MARRACSAGGQPLPGPSHLANRLVGILHGCLSHHTLLVARSAELAILTGAIEATRRGRGEAVLLTEEAGLGKPVC